MKTSTVLLLAILEGVLEPKKYPQSDFIRNLKKGMELSFLRDLPSQFASDFIELAGQKYYCGYILKRPLLNKEFGSLKLEYHYGIVLGTSDAGKQLIIEMTKGKNVRIITIEQFLKPFDLYHLKIELAREFPRDKIIERAKELRFETYNLFDLNCKDFVQWCIYGVEPFKLSKELNKLYPYIKSINQNLRLRNRNVS